MNTTQITASMLLFPLLLTCCQTTGRSTPNPAPIEEFPVIDVQNPKENFLGLDNITLKSKIDPQYHQNGIEVRQYWYMAPLGDFADKTKVNTDGTFTLTILANKINADTNQAYGFKAYYGSPEDIPVHILQYDTNVAHLNLVQGEVHRKAGTIKYNEVVYATQDITYVKIVNTYPAFPNGFTFSVNLKKGFNMVYYQESMGKKGLLTTSVHYNPGQFTSFYNN
ncbi:hypothetical protein [Deinococcus cellulosilyticus]|nr:hypothetical protein [Deinococcus cellulosilyticus]